LASFSIFSSDVDRRLLSLDRILKSIKAHFLATTSFKDAENSQEMLMSSPAPPVSAFWNDLGYAIYLLKVLSPERVWLLNGHLIGGWKA
jgi:hypothetical protein